MHVDSIDSIFTRDEVRAVARARERGWARTRCTAWRGNSRWTCGWSATSSRPSEGVKIKLIPIPREIMEKNRKEPPPFLEVAVLEAEPVIHSKGR